MIFFVFFIGLVFNTLPYTVERVMNINGGK